MEQIYGTYTTGRWASKFRHDFVESALRRYLVALYVAGAHSAAATYEAITYLRVVFWVEGPPLYCSSWSCLVYRCFLQDRIGMIILDCIMPLVKKSRCTIKRAIVV